jgi:tetratricopeptide (TPR) repeat protein
MNEFCMPLLLRDFALSGATGTLTVRAPHPAALVGTVLFEDGVVVFARTRPEKDPTGELFMELLADAGIGTDEEDRERYEQQVAQTVVDMFHWQSAEASFHDGMGIERWPRIPLAAASLFRDGLRSVEDQALVERWVGDLDQVVGIGEDPFELAHALSSSPAPSTLLDRAERHATLRDLIAGEGGTRDDALRLVAALLFGGALEVRYAPAGAELWVGAPDSVPEGPEPAATLPFDPAEAASFWYLIESKQRAVAEAVDHYAFLEVGRRASHGDIRDAYDTLVSALDPAWARDSSSGVAEFEAEIARVRAAADRAFDVLGDPSSRSRYDEELARREQERGLRVEAPQRPVTAPLPTPSVAPRPVAPTAPLHRPQAPPLNPPLAASVPAASPVVEVAACAASGQSSVPSRPEHDANAARFVLGKVAADLPAPTLSAGDWLMRGKAYASAGDHSRAVHAFELALQGFPDEPLVHLLLGRSLRHLPDCLERAEESLMRASRLAPLSHVPQLELGLYYKSVGRPAEARTALSAALQLGPDDPRAIRALAELDDQQRRSNGLLGRLLHR